MYSPICSSFPPKSLPKHTHTLFTSSPSIHRLQLLPLQFSLFLCSMQSLCAPKPPNPLKLLFNSRSPALLSLPLPQTHTHRITQLHWEKLESQLGLHCWKDQGELCLDNTLSSLTLTEDLMYVGRQRILGGVGLSYRVGGSPDFWLTHQVSECTQESLVYDKWWMKECRTQEYSWMFSFTRMKRGKIYFNTLKVSLSCASVQRPRLKDDN